MSKKTITPEQKYKRNQKRAKFCKVLTPVLFWICLAIAFSCLLLAIKNSFGNIAEIVDLLDSKKYNGDELRSNYEYLIAKYGEWVIGTGGQGFTITFVNIGNALFSGLMILNCFLFLIFLVTK